MFVSELTRAALIPETLAKSVNNSIQTEPVKPAIEPHTEQILLIPALGKRWSCLPKVALRRAAEIEPPLLHLSQCGFREAFFEKRPPWREGTHTEHNTPPPQHRTYHST